MDAILNIVNAVNSVLWDWVLLFLLCGTGIYFTFRLKFIQVRKFGAGFKKLFSGFSFKGKKNSDGGMTSFQSFATAIAAQVGTGNLAGAAAAMIAGGPGAIFWMWVSAFFGMATIYVEATLAQKYRRLDENGSIVGGPVYYITAVFQGKFGKILAAIFSVLVMIALGFTGNMVQSNSIGEAFQSTFASFGITWQIGGVNMIPVIVGVVIAIFAFLIFVGGVSRIASVTEKIVPIMAGFYILGALIVIFVNITEIPHAFAQIVVGAFSPGAALGAAVGIGIQKAIRFGVSRGLFSNEAGMGSHPHAHAIAKVKRPGDQGLVAMTSVFIDTFVILTMTALVILVTGVLPDGINGLYSGIDLTQAGFSKVFGSFGSIFIAICSLFFAFSTIIGWYFFGEANIRYLFGKKAVKVYAVIVSLLVIVGCFLKVDLVWALSDCFNGLMVIPNLIALLALSGVAVKMMRDYEHETRLESPKIPKKNKTKC